MSDARCEQARRRLMEGDAPEADLARHLEDCADCASEASRLESLFVLLRADASAEPAAALDTWVRAMLAGPSEPARWFVRPVASTGLATAAFLCLLVTVAVWLAEAGAAEGGLLLAFVIGAVYLTISTAVTLPLLLHRRLRPIRHIEVRT